jgi:hypothetical protein
MKCGGSTSGEEKSFIRKATERLRPYATKEETMNKTLITMMSVAIFLFVSPSTSRGRGE